LKITSASSFAGPAISFAAIGRSFIASFWGDENKVECFGMLGELDYECFVAANDTLEPYDSARHGQINFFFVPRERRADYTSAKA